MTRDFQENLCKYFFLDYTDTVMTKLQRIVQVLNGVTADRVPFSAYMHSTVHDKTPAGFTAFTLDFYRKYDPDYVKVMFDEHYDLPVTYDFVRTCKVWRLLEEFDEHIGAFGRQLQALKRIKDAVGPDVPVIQTIFLPFHFGMRLAYRRILADLNQNPEAVLNGLHTIASNTMRFGRACLKEAGIDGFFFGAYGCEQAWMNEQQYKEQVMPLDMKVIKALNDAPVTILHIHGENKSYFSLLKSYPCKALSWEDRLAGPPLAQALTLTGKCLVGGINHRLARTCSPEEIIQQGREAIAATGGKRLILAPGCTFPPDTPPANILALKKAATGYK
jgi:uroporphyrinogen decarboxylase